MPQKRNPVAIEHARAIGSKALGQAQAIALAVHNTPFGDIVDTEDDLQPLVWSMFRDAMRDRPARGSRDADRDVRRGAPGGARRAGRDDDVTELADTLVREHGLPFKTAHAITTRVLRIRSEHPDAKPNETLAAVAFELLGTPHRLHARSGCEEILSPRYFVAVRRDAWRSGARADVVRARGLAGATRHRRQWYAERRGALAARSGSSPSGAPRCSSILAMTKAD